MGLCKREEDEAQLMNIIDALTPLIMMMLAAPWPTSKVTDSQHSPDSNIPQR